MKKEKKIRKRKKKDPIYTPMKMTQALQELGEAYNKKEAFLFYGMVFLLALLLGIFFQLSPGWIVAGILVYLLAVPRLMYNNKKRNYERKRFQEVNAYMSQMAQSFTGTGNILVSLKETANTFPNGRMHDALQDAVVTIVHTSGDVREVERSALKLIEEKFDCEKLRNLHDFLLKAEARGGDCAVEFQILERIRGVWENAVLEYYKKMVNTRNLVMLEYGLLLAVCIFVLTQFPEELQIIHILAVQFVNFIQIVLFMVLFCHMDKKLNSSLLKDPDVMTKEKADRSLGYIQAFDPKRERKKNLPFLIVAVIVFVILFVVEPGAISVGAGIFFLVLVCNMHRISFFMTLQSLKKEVRKEFPKWLFDVTLLIQSDSVEVAIFKSIDKAPPVLVEELKRIRDILVKTPGNADAYMSFFADYHIPGIEPAMRKLYSLSVGTGGNGGVMEVIIDSNMTMLTEAEKRSIRTRGDMSALYQFLPMLPVSVGIMIYCIVLIAVVFQNIMTLI